MSAVAHFFLHFRLPQGRRGLVPSGDRVLHLPAVHVPPAPLASARASCMSRRPPRLACPSALAGPPSRLLRRSLFAKLLFPLSLSSIVLSWTISCAYPRPRPLSHVRKARFHVRRSCFLSRSHLRHVFLPIPSLRLTSLLAARAGASGQRRAARHILCCPYRVPPRVVRIQRPHLLSSLSRSSSKFLATLPTRRRDAACPAPLPTRSCELHSCHVRILGTPAFLRVVETLLALLGLLDLGVRARWQLLPPDPRAREYDQLAHHDPGAPPRAGLRAKARDPPEYAPKCELQHAPDTRQNTRLG
eukprot:4420177-Pleurochrysis_carterae.AAC.1